MTSLTWLTYLTECLQGAMRKGNLKKKEQQRQKMGHYSKTDTAGAYAQTEKAEEC